MQKFEIHLRICARGLCGPVVLVVKVLVQGSIAAGPLAALVILALLPFSLLGRLVLLAFLPLQGLLVPSLAWAQYLGGGDCCSDGHGYGFCYHLPVRCHASRSFPGTRVHHWRRHLRLLVGSVHFLVRDYVGYTIPVHRWLAFVVLRTVPCAGPLRFCCLLQFDGWARRRDRRGVRGIDRI